METNNNVQTSRQNFPWPVIAAVANRHACGGVVHARYTYEADSWKLAVIHIEQIVLRGNAAQMVNVAGKFLIKELVIK